MILTLNLKNDQPLKNNNLEEFNFIEPIGDTPAETKVYLIHLKNVDQGLINKFSLYLDSTEQRLYQKTTNNQKRFTFCVCRFVLKHLIGDLLSTDPLNICFHYTDRGKPYLAENKIQFNISHSGDYALIGLSKYKIGVDIEIMKEKRNFKLLANTVLSEEEKRWVFEHDTKQRFYTLWTLKEARLKCDGSGIAGKFPIADFDPLKGWGFEKYMVSSNFINDAYAYSICVNKV